MVKDASPPDQALTLKVVHYVYTHKEIEVKFIITVIKCITGTK